MQEYKQFKYYFNRELAEFLSDKISKVYPEFQKQNFVEQIDSKIHKMELKDRVKVITCSLYEFLPQRYEEAIEILLKILGKPNENETGMFKKWYWVMPIAYFVETYGINDFNKSIDAIYQITQRNTGEYAVRPFLVKYPTKMLSIMLNWSKNENVHIRRLSSEGVRPRLPWAKKLEQFIKDPTPILPILENLKEDQSMFVKKSVANNLSDILKDNYNIGINLLEKWSLSNNKDTLWIIKHSLRNEIKKGNPMVEKIIHQI